MSKQPYSLIAQHNAKGHFVKYVIVDAKGVAIGEAKRNRCNYDVKYYTTRSEVEFLTYCDSLSASDVVDALTSHL